jgi:hypothetical protein
VTVRSDRATAGLLAPPVHAVDEVALARVRTALESGVTDAAAGLARGAPCELGLPQLRRARYRPDLLALPEEPFAWKPAFVRRSLGLELVRACAAGRFRGPADAAGAVADHAVEEWRRTGWRTFHWEPWFAGLGPGARSVVRAEAITWATPLWAAFDWRSLAGVADSAVPDDTWTCPGARPPRLKGRTEVRVRSSTGRPTLVSVASGCPGDGWRDELAFPALVAALAGPGTPVVSRVVGLWPESGFRLAVDIDEVALCGAVERVVDAVAVIAEVQSAGAPIGVG